MASFPSFLFLSIIVRNLSHFAFALLELLLMQIPVVLELAKASFGAMETFMLDEQAVNHNAYLELLHFLLHGLNCITIIEYGGMVNFLFQWRVAFPIEVWNKILRQLQSLSRLALLFHTNIMLHLLSLGSMTIDLIFLTIGTLMLIALLCRFHYFLWFISDFRAKLLRISSREPSLLLRVRWFLVGINDYVLYGRGIRGWNKWSL